jgi:signal transduction histidine kinase
VIQESLNNAVRHGRPGRISVAMSLGAEGEVITRISDDGAATKPADPARLDQSGFGLIGMRERVTASGGSLSIDQDGPDGGWSVVARVPATAPAPGRSRERAA